MVNSRIKGRNAEKEYAALLSKKGWQVELVKPGSKFSRSVDFFNVGDIIAFHSVNRVWMIVQVKCNSARGAIKLLSEWKRIYNPPHTICAVAVRRDNSKEEHRWRVTEV